eukprot:scaffold1426_cov83-Cylindrotheca_fusiformis.AAC.13
MGSKQKQHGTTLSSVGCVGFAETDRSNAIWNRLSNGLKQQPPSSTGIDTRKILMCTVEKN